MERMEKTTGILDSYREGLHYNNGHYFWIKLEDGTIHYVYGHLYFPVIIIWRMQKRVRKSIYMNIRKHVLLLTESFCNSRRTGNEI